MFFRFNLKRTWRPALILLIVVLLGLGMVRVFYSKFSVFPYDVNNNDQALPWTHWVMMGMTEHPTTIPGKNWIGSWNLDSCLYTTSFSNTEEMKEANIKKIQEQYNDWGFEGYLKFLYRKMLFAWSDGTFYAPMYVNWITLFHEGDIIETIFENNDFRRFTFYYSTGMMLVLYIGMLIGAWYNFRYKKNRFNYAFLMIFGLLVFLLIWETTSRYLFNYYPVMVLLAVYGFNVIIDNKNNNVAGRIWRKRIGNARKKGDIGQQERY